MEKSKPTIADSAGTEPNKEKTFGMAADKAGRHSKNAHRSSNNTKLIRWTKLEHFGKIQNGGLVMKRDGPGSRINPNNSNNNCFFFLKSAYAIKLRII